ncbi:hypothetical protein B296_00010333 [Ensete ventricosum]|uniref:Uncharacterized protein n=1 Tax=Ensete ventricosum TaxID=4639 RepID=A0A426ZKU8_ENSVE|nr:hypothetical protein B296_00010333 [Ensete ventricosum]
MNSGTNIGDLAERANSDINLGDLAERVNSSTNLGDLAERANSGTNLGGLAKRVNSGSNLGDVSERANAGTNLRDLAERANSSKNLGDLAERANSGTDLGDLTERANSGTNLEDLVERQTRAQILEIWPRRRTQAHIACYDLDTAVTKGSLAVIRELYSILTEYRLFVPQPGQRPYSSDMPIVASNSWRYLVVFLGESREAEIILTQNLFMACFRLCKSRGGYYLTARVGFRVSGAPSNNKGWKSRYLFVSGPNWGFRLDWLAHPISNVPPYLSEKESVLVGKLK